MKFKILFLALICSLWLSVLGSSQVLAATYVVTKTADTNDGVCDADCSLREAINAANANTGADTINFNIPVSDGGYIAASGPTQDYFSLPFTTSFDLTDAAGVFIDGYSQSGAFRNTAPFGQTINTVLKIEVTGSSRLNINSGADGNHIAGLAFNSSLVNNLIDATDTDNNWFEGNFFGSNITGTASKLCGAIDVKAPASANIIGTNGDGSGDAGERNLFLGCGSMANTRGTIQIIDADSAYTNANNNNIIAGNYIGVDVSGRVCGTAAMNRSHILIDDGSNNRVGTNYDGISDTEEANILACINTDTRTLVRVTAQTDSYIQGNYIGTNPSLDNLTAISIHGIDLRDVGSNGVLIKGNTIAYNGSRGIASTVASSNSGNTFSQNTIFGNGSLGIDLGLDGVTVNDAGDLDTGSNDLMNYPVIDKAGLSSNGKLLVQADLDFNPAEAPYTLEFFDNNDIDSSGFGEGKYFIGSVTTSQTGNNIALTIPITGTAPTAVAKITATATNANGSTSEFSAPPIDPTTYATLTSGSISINNGDSDASSSSVVLSINVVGEFYTVAGMKISNTADFSGINYENYATSKEWSLSPGNGMQTVYALFKDSQENESGVYSDTITVTLPQNRGGGAGAGVDGGGGGGSPGVRTKAVPVLLVVWADAIMQSMQASFTGLLYGNSNPQTTIFQSWLKILNSFLACEIEPKGPFIQSIIKAFKVFQTKCNTSSFGTLAMANLGLASLENQCLDYKRELDEK